MQLKDKNESLSTSLYRWGLAFNDNLELAKKVVSPLENLKIFVKK